MISSREALCLSPFSPSIFSTLLRPTSCSSSSRFYHLHELAIILHLYSLFFLTNTFRILCFHLTLPHFVLFFCFASMIPNFSSTLFHLLLYCALTWVGTYFSCSCDSMLVILLFTAFSSFMLPGSLHHDSLVFRFNRPQSH